MQGGRGGWRPEVANSLVAVKAEEPADGDGEKKRAQNRDCEHEEKYTACRKKCSFLRAPPPGCLPPPPPACSLRSTRLRAVHAASGSRLYE
jgi:hypothetical protein